MASQWEIFVYLDDLQKAGIENMLDMHTVIARKFELPPHRAYELIRHWVKRYMKKQEKPPYSLKILSSKIHHGSSIV